ncbi:MAG: RNA methyltransferase, partial [Myxococcales bacterium]|nr:RNA methyltransferase [Myxococcales bacterium]
MTGAPRELFDRVRIVLCRPSHPGNIGAVARAMKVMAFDDLVIVGPRRPPKDEEAEARAVGAMDVLERAPVVETLAEAIADCAYVVGFTARDRHVGPPTTDVAEAAGVILERVQEGRVALLFGNERTGLENDELNTCHARVRIPTGETLASLNLAAAVQVACYELHKTFRDAEPTGDDGRVEAPATSAEIDAFLARVWERSAQHRRYNATDKRIAHLKSRFRMLVSRARPTKQELKAAHGVLTWLDFDQVAPGT